MEASNKQTFKRFSTVALATLLCVGITACGSLSKVKDDGTTDDPVFPELDKAWFDHDHGTIAEAEEIRKIRPNMTRDQVYELIGRPQFSEGFRVREWDYLFQFQTANGLKPCQYKILFDKDYRTRSFFWKPTNCADLLKVKAVEPRVVERVKVVEKVIEKPAPAPAPQRFTLQGDGLFAFAQSDIRYLSASGRTELDRIANQLQSANVDSVRVTAHTDRIGSDASNMRLSQARANSVKQYLAQRGVPARMITAVGVGEQQPVTQCADSMGRKALVRCLAPNRRVEVEAFGVR